MAGVENVQTDIETQTVTIEYKNGADMESILAEVASKNNKLKDFKILEN